MVVKHKIQITYSDESTDEFYISSTGVLSFENTLKELCCVEYTNLMKILIKIRNWLATNGGEDINIEEEEE